jgi:DnaJ-class molecular chaperone
LDGHEVTLSNAAVTKPGQIIKIAGEGMPHFNYPSDKGDLYVEISIQMPESVTEEQKQGSFSLYRAFFLCFLASNCLCTFFSLSSLH